MQAERKQTKVKYMNLLISALASLFHKFPDENTGQK
jgi:hypothetical protein